MCARREGERGAALAAVLVTVALLMPLGALAVMQARIGLLTQQSLRGDVEALHAAEASLACALARLGPALDFDALPRGADGRAGTADDGVLPFALDCELAQSGAVRVEAGGAQTIVLVASGRGTRGATRTIERRAQRIGPATVLVGAWRER